MNICVPFLLQAAAYEVRIRALEAHLARSSGARSGAYSTAASTYASGAASASASAYISGAASAYISGGSPSASSHGSCAVASVSSPSGHLPIAGAPGDAAAPTLHPGGECFSFDAETCILMLHPCCRCQCRSWPFSLDFHDGTSLLSEA